MGDVWGVFLFRNSKTVLIILILHYVHHAKSLYHFVMGYCADNNGSMLNDDDVLWN